MESNLRPLSLGEILDRTAQLYRTNFLLFAGIAAVYAGGLLVLGLLQIGFAEMLRVMHMTERLQWLTWTATGIAWLLIFLFAGMAIAANNRAVAWVHLGEPATIRGAYRSILPRLGRYLWLMTIVAFFVWTPFVLLYGGYLLTIFLYLPKGYQAHPDPANSHAMLIFGIASLAFVLLLIPVGIYTVLMALRYSLAVPASVVENLTARNALRRSIDLSKGSRGRIFMLGLLVYVIDLGLVGITQGFFIVAAFKNPGHFLSAGMQSLQQIIGFFTNTFVGPMYATGITLFYYDQRVRKEGYDIEWMMQAAGLTVPEPAAAAEPIAPPAAEPWLALDAHFEAPPVATQITPQDPPPHDSGIAHE
ncbi:MAG: hypothetical protein ABSE51_08780 [Terracidiphilus sp.]|jgi:uncharacterized membrane protein